MTQTSASGLRYFEGKANTPDLHDLQLMLPLVRAVHHTYDLHVALRNTYEQSVFWVGSVPYTSCTTTRKGRRRIYLDVQIDRELHTECP